MQTKLRSFLGKIRPWVWITIVAAVLICCLVILFFCLFRDGKFPEAPTETTALPTEPEPAPTLPPNPFGPESFYKEGKFLACRDGEYMLGVDISDWQGLVNWQLAKEEGIEFAIIRVGYRGYDEGLLYADEYAQRNYEAARREGILVGAYFFSQATTPEEAVEEAEFLLELTRDWELELPVAFDWEHLGDDNRTANVDPIILTQCAMAFCQRVEQEGLRGMIYFNPDYAARRLSLEMLQDYEFWLAYYDDEMPFPHRVNMWQYTDQGRVDGIRDGTGNVDINLRFIYHDEKREESYE